MKRFDFVFTIIQVPLDYLMLILAGLASYYLRYQELVTQVRPVFFDISFDVYIRLLYLVGLAGVVVFAWSGLYQSGKVSRRGEEFKKIFFGVSTTLLIIVVAIFLRRELFSSRFVILLAWIFAVVFVSLARWGLGLLKGFILSHSSWGYTIVVIGQGKVLEVIKSYYQTRATLGYKIVATVPDFSSDSQAILREIASKGELDELIQLNTDAKANETEEIIAFCNDHQVNLLYLASFLQTQLINYEVLNVAGYPIIRVKKTPLDGWGRITKRAFDFLVSLLLIIVLSPLFLIIIIIIKFDSPGPAFFSLQRVGQKGKLFRCFKFRSMVNGAHDLKKDLTSYNERADGPLFKMKHDPRVTRCGRWLRRSSLDELPQLWNVLRGEMSLVGPRPHEPEEVSRYTSQYRKLLTLKPGITGAAQVSGRSSLPFDEEVRIDIYYIENWSMAEDVRILLRTPGAVVNYENAV